MQRRQVVQQRRLLAASRTHQQLAHIQGLQHRPRSRRVETRKHVSGVLARVRVHHAPARMLGRPAADVVHLRRGGKC